MLSTGSGLALASIWLMPSAAFISKTVKSKGGWMLVVSFTFAATLLIFMGNS